MLDNFPKREQEKPIKLWNSRLEPIEVEATKTKDLFNQYKDKIVVVDTETTGIYLYDEILQLSIIDGDGEVLFNHYIKPRSKKKWDKAEKVHHISPQTVENEQRLSYYKNELIDILKDKIVVGYNIVFDYKHLVKSKLISGELKTLDVMKPFAVVFGEWNNRTSNYRFQTLETCTQYYNYDWNGEAHDSLADTLATLYCLKQLKEVDITTWIKIPQ